MDFWTYTTMREWTQRVDADDRPAQDIDLFYKRAILDAQKMGSGLFGQMHNERDWEKARRPYYNVWPSIIPMLTRLNLDIDSDLIQLPLPALCIRFPKDAAKNPLKFDCRRGGPIHRAFLAGSRGRRGPRGQENCKVLRRAEFIPLSCFFFLHGNGMNSVLRGAFPETLQFSWAGAVLDEFKGRW